MGGLMTLADLLVAIIVVAMLAPPVTFAWDAFAKRHPYLTDDILDWWDYRRAMLHLHRTVRSAGRFRRLHRRQHSWPVSDMSGQ